MVFNVPAAHTRGVFDLHSVELDGADVAHTLDQTTLTVKLPHDLNPGEAITLTLKYAVRVPELNDPQSFGDANLAYTDDAMSIGYWYPMLAPYRSGAGWYATEWQSIGDPFVSEVADYTAVITTTPDVTVVAGGDLSRTENVWRYDLPRARTFGMIASKDYRALSLPFGGVTYTVLHFAAACAPRLGRVEDDDSSRAVVYVFVWTVSVSSRCGWPSSAGRGAWSSRASWCWARASSTITMARCATA